jgi:hypothetical protein
VFGGIQQGCYRILPTCWNSPIKLKVNSSNRHAANANTPFVELIKRNFRKLLVFLLF